MSHSDRRTHLVLWYSRRSEKAAALMVLDRVHDPRMMDQRLHRKWYFRSWRQRHACDANALICHPQRRFFRRRSMCRTEQWWPTTTLVV
jgi:hypothetical protein